MYSWPSAPRFHSDIRAARATARPVRMRGVEAASVWAIAFEEPKAPVHMAR